MREFPSPRRAALLTARPTLWSAVVPVIALLAGLLFTASGHAARGTELRSELTGVPDLIRARSLTNLKTARDIELTRRQVADLSTRVAPRSTRLQALTKDGDALAAAAGTTPVRGPAVSVTLDDSPMTSDQLPDWADVNDIVVHQQDVQAVVNALWRGGAEAMMIQDQRLIATSAVRCVGNTLILQGRVYSPPFVVNAIGPVQAMRDELDADPQIAIYLQWVDAVGLGWEVTSLGNTRFAAYSGSVAQSSATAVR